MTVRCLSIHAGYRCLHTGACCSGVFAIPAEPRVVQIVSGLRLQPAVDGALFVRGVGAPDTEFVGVRADGACVFVETEDGRFCSIHRRAGVGALPSSCRHFPRVFLHDARGLFLSLSHFCPTAAGLLMDDEPLTIVEAAAPVALEGDVEAFDALDALPPLLRPGVLMDLDAYDVWERMSIDTFARSDLTHEQALAVVAAASESVRRWKAGGRSLAAFVEDAFATADRASLASDDRQRDSSRLRLIDPAHPTGVFPSHNWDGFDSPLKRYLAAKLFGHRFAYEGRGLRSMVEWLRVCLALVRHEAARLTASGGGVFDRDVFIEAIRAADLVLVHRIDTPALARRLEPLEQQP